MLACLGLCGYLQDHCKAHHDDWKPIPCHNKSKGCLLRFSDVANMRKHVKVSCKKTPEKERETHKFKCTEPGCTKIFTRKDTLYDHFYQCHTREGQEGESQHKCGACGGGFQSASALFRYKRTVQCGGNAIRKARGTKLRNEVLCESSPTKKSKY